MKKAKLREFIRDRTQDFYTEINRQLSQIDPEVWLDEYRNEQHLEEVSGCAAAAKAGNCDRA